MTQLPSRLGTMCLAAGLSFACGGDGGGNGGGTQPPPPDPPAVASVTISQPPDTLASFGERVLLTATVLDQNGGAITDRSISWTTSDQAVATITATGLLVSRGNGIASVIAAVDSAADTVSIVVNQVVAGVDLFPALAVLELPGDTITVTGEPVDAQGNPVAGAGPVTWAASGPVTISPSGLAQANGFGVGVITGTADGKSSSVNVEVIGDRFFLSSGTRMRYDLDLPGGSGPFPAIIWVHGSGQMTRNTQKGATDPLVPQGLAVLRYDKRGVGESGGSYTGVSAGNSFSTLGTLANDAANAVRFLARLPQIDTARIGIMGNSQAGWIVPQAARRASEVVSYIMLWSGPTISVGLEIYYSNLAEGTTTPLDVVYAQLDNFNGTEGYDALSDVTALDIPAQWQYGDYDRSIPMRLDVQRLNALQAQGKPFDVVVWPFADHALRDTRTGQFYDVWSEYLRFMQDNGILP